jgi:hypothetical protein
VRGPGESRKSDGGIRRASYEAARGGRAEGKVGADARLISGGPAPCEMDLTGCDYEMVWR